MKSFIVTALLLTSVYATAQSGMGASATGTSTMAPSTGTSDTPASDSVIDRSTMPADQSRSPQQKMEEAESMRDAQDHEDRELESNDTMNP